MLELNWGHSWLTAQLQCCWNTKVEGGEAPKFMLGNYEQKRTWQQMGTQDKRNRDDIGIGV